LSEKSVGEGLDCSLNGLAKTIADTGAGFDGIEVVALDETFSGGLGRNRKTRRVEEAVKECEVGVEAVGEDTVEVELKVSEFDEAGAVTKEPEKSAVGDEAVGLVGEVEIFLHETMRRHAGA
jgi:hypothetical protein